MTNNIHHRLYLRLAIFTIFVQQALLLIHTKIPDPVEIVDLVGTNRVFNEFKSSVEPKSLFLPRRVVTVFGLESTGTTFVTHLLELSTGVKQCHIIMGHMDRLSTKESRDYELQHLSLPFGWIGEGQINVVPALYPAMCVDMQRAQSLPKPSKLPTQCQQTMGGDESKYRYPRRYFVNITSHIQWYRDRGVDASAVLVVRDKTIGSIARSFVHCIKNKTREQEEQVGLSIMKEAMEYYQQPDPRYPSPPLVVASYETIINMGAPYVNFLLNQLQLPSIHENKRWAIKDGNERYIQPHEQVAKLEAKKKPKKVRRVDPVASLR
jgi:hypothetical protein